MVSMYVQFLDSSFVEKVTGFLIYIMFKHAKGQIGINGAISYLAEKNSMYEWSVITW